MATYGYARVSTGRQASEGESLDVQGRTIEGYAMMQGLAVDRLFVERGVSGSKPLSERPEGAKLLTVLSAGDAVITAKLDRMFRSALDALEVLAELKERGISLHMVDLGGDVTGNGISKLVFTILSAVAEAERDRIRERVADTKQDQRARGRYLGGKTPFGYRASKDGALEPVESEQAVIADVLKIRSAGAPLRRIAVEIEARHGARLALGTLSKIVKGAQVEGTREWPA